MHIVSGSDPAPSLEIEIEVKCIQSGPGPIEYRTRIFIDSFKYSDGLEVNIDPKEAWFFPTYDCYRTNNEN